MSTTLKLDVYDIVTTRIIELLQQGTIPWRRPWMDAGPPKNLLSKRPYRGINVWLLATLNYAQNFFLTWDQLKKIGGSVKQGEHGHVVVFWKTIRKDTELEDDKQQTHSTRSILRYYKVFNIEQCRDIPEDLIPSNNHRESEVMLECESVINQMPACPSIRHRQHRAFYDVQKDYINMPKLKTFESDESYYGTLFHELVHSTGHEKRLNRKSITDMHEFGSEAYSLEELIAEMGSCYLCHFTGILNAEIENSVAYIDGWLGQLKKDKRFVIIAASHAQKAVDFILNLKEEETAHEPEVEQAEVLV